MTVSLSFVTFYIPGRPPTSASFRCILDLFSLFALRVVILFFSSAFFLATKVDFFLLFETFLQETFSKLHWPRFSNLHRRRRVRKG